MSRHCRFLLSLCLLMLMSPSWLHAQKLRVCGSTFRSSIPHNNTNTDIFNQCDFGSLDYQSGSKTQTFEIDNPVLLGTLSITGPITISGPNASQFQVTSQPGDTSLSPGKSTSFAIEFDPTSAGFKIATVNIPNNDNTNFVFQIDGSGDVISVQPTPELGVTKLIPGSTKITRAGSLTFMSLKGSIEVSNSDDFAPPLSSVRIYYSADDVLDHETEPALYQQYVKELTKGKPRTLKFKLDIAGKTSGNVFFRIIPVGFRDASYSDNQYRKQFTSF